MKLRPTTVLLVAVATLVTACSNSSSSDGSTGPRVKNEALGSTQPSITKIEPGDGSLTVFVTLPEGTDPNTWFYQLATTTPGAANSLGGGTETVRNAPPSFTITGLTNGATYTVRVAHWNGETSAYASADAVVGLVAPTTTVARTACRNGGDCAIGDTGPGGGLVFFDAGTAQPWGRYLEVAQENLPASTFGCAGTAPVVAIATVGGGFASTEELASSPCGSNSAAASAYNFAPSGVSGWYLPSKDELNELCKFANNQTTGDTSAVCIKGDALRPGFTPTFYWSSTQDGNDFAWYQNFVTGQQLRYGKPATAAIRPIRAFTNKDGITVPTTLAPKPCKRGGACKVGDKGPGGGIVFYDAGSVQSWGRYMEITAAPLDLGSWGCEQTANLSTSRAFGSGQANTRNLVAAGCTSARIADDYSINGVSDWFLPSDDELLAAARAGAFSGVSSAWTSSDDGCFSGYCFTFTRGPDGSRGSVGRTTYSASVGTFAVRAFGKAA